MTLHMRPPKLSLSPERNPSSSSAALSSQDTSATPTPFGKHIGHSNKGTVLYKTLSPRKKFDEFGLDRTDYKAYCLSTTVFPTAVKATLLGELQDSNPHSCGFDIVDKPTGESTILSISSSVPSCNTSVINAPPPTAVTSHRGAQSAPVVAFVEIPSAGMALPSHRHPSAATKSTANSQVFSDVTSGHDDEDRDYNNAHALPEVDYTDNDLSRNDVTGNDARGHRKQQQQQRLGDGPALRSSLSSVNGRSSLIHGATNKFHAKRSDFPSRSMGNSQQTSPKVQSFSRFDERRLIRYEWKSRDVRVEEDKKDGGEIRDTMYLNTFCPEERPVRFNKISLPRIGRSSRQRPWTVNESKFNSRSALALISKSNDNFSRLDRTLTPAHPAHHQSSLKGGRGPAGHHRGVTNGGVSRSAGHLKLRQNQQHAWREQAVIDANHHHHNDDDNYDDDNDDDDDKENDNSNNNNNDNGGSLGTTNNINNNNNNNKPLLEIRSFLSSSALKDQREKLKGKNGCLNSRVKQCVRFVRYRERLDKHEENRPLKSEHGKYRPFSKTDVRGHYPSNPAPTPELKLQQSVETYQQYVDTIARQTNLSSPKPNFSFRTSGGGGGAGVISGGGISGVGFNATRIRPGPKLAGALSSFDTMAGESPISVLQTLDSSRPDGVANNSSARNSTDTPRPQNSAIYTKDVSSMGHALDIKRISPVPTVNRVVPGTREVITRGGNSPRALLATNEEEGNEGAGEEGVGAEEEEDGYPMTLTPGQHGDTIVLPRASTKSECPSEYSVSKDD